MMTSHFKPSSLPSSVDPIELDRAIHNLEFAKKQQLEELEKEKQQIAALEAALKEKQDGIRKMDGEIARMDEETKNCHRQFRQNKESKDSLKKNATILHSHLESVEEKLQRLAEKYEAESVQHGETLQHYNTIWKSYEEVYMEQANAQELRKWQLEVLQRKEAIKEGHHNIACLQEEVNDLRAHIKDNEPPFPNIRDFVIKMAEIKVSTMANTSEMEQLVVAISSAEKEVAVLQENQAEIMKRIEEKRRQEEHERQQKEQEKAQREKAQELTRIKEQQTAATTGQSGAYKFGQFIHRAPNHQPPPSRVPINTKRGFPVRPPPSSPRTPIMVPFPARQAARLAAPRTPVPGIAYPIPAKKYSVPQSPVYTSAATPAKTGSGLMVEAAAASSGQHASRFFLNLPPRSPRAPPSIHPVPGGMPSVQQLTGQRPSMGSSFLPTSLHQMSLQPSSGPNPTPPELPRGAPIRTTAASAGPAQLACPPSPAPAQMDTGSHRQGPLPGPGGDAQPCADDAINQPRMSEAMQYDSMPQLDRSICGVGEMEAIEDFPPTSQESVTMDSCTRTPKTPDGGFDMQGLKTKMESVKSPGFSYSFRSMFGERDDTVQEPTPTSESGDKDQENLFFSSLFGMGGKTSDRAASPSPANMFGDGGFGSNRDQNPSTPAMPQCEGGGRGAEGGAMSMFGDSPSSALQSPPQRQESMGFSLNFGDSGPAPQDSTAGGAGSKSGFCLF